MIFFTISDSQISNDQEPGAFESVAPYYDELMSSVPYERWLVYLKSLWRLHRLEPRLLLDLACGTGTMTRLFAAQGYRLTGVDLSGGMLETARARATAESLQIPYFQQDAADLDLGMQRFDGVYSVFDSLNYILDPERLRSAFQRVFAHLTPGGAFIFDVNTEYALSEGMFNQSCTRRDEKLHYRWRSYWDPASRICTVKMNFSYDTGSGERQTFKEVHRQRAYTKEELSAWLREAGFEQVFIYDAYTTRPPQKRSDRLHIVAVKELAAEE